VELLQETIKNLEKEDPELCRDLRAACTSGKLRLQTVDASQGSEANIVILSGVRSNAEGGVGFLAKSVGEKRICVAISRACEALFVVGDKATLASPSTGLAFGLLWSLSGTELTPRRQLTVLASFSDLRRNVRAQRVADNVLVAEVYGGIGLLPKTHASETSEDDEETEKNKQGVCADGEFSF
jgi:hypothetical protein